MALNKSRCLYRYNNVECIVEIDFMLHSGYMPVGKSVTSVGDSEYSLVLSTATMFASNSLAMRTIQFKSSVTCYQ